MRTANPALNDKVFTVEGVHDNVMTLQGTVMKTAILLGIVVVGAGFTWNQTSANPQLAQGLTMGGAVVGLGARSVGSVCRVRSLIARARPY